MTHGWAKAMADGRAAVYRAFDADGVLLYVGVSLNPMARMHSHCSRAAWYRFMVRIEINWHDNIEAASIAEASAITAENPRFNVAGATRRWALVRCGPAEQKRRAETATRMEALFVAKYPALKASP